jgi:hypothetical protein
VRTNHLVIRAGARAAKRLREEGFRADLFDTLVGASGGPKWLVLRALDNVLIDRMILGRSQPIATLGSSIGSFRHACFAQRDSHSALARFAEAYVEQAYAGRPTMEEISTESDRILDHFLGVAGSEEIVNNQFVQSHLIASRLRRDRGHDRGIPFQLQLAAAAGLNLLSRRLLARSFSRVLFQATRPAIEFDDFETTAVRLTTKNLQPALLASGSIPMVMAGVRSIPEIQGTLFDGGIIDYHFDFAFKRLRTEDLAGVHAETDTRSGGLTLFPHFFDRITPGWFDKPLKWRRPSAEALANVVMIAPSDAFVKKLPGGKIPDRNDFLKLETKDRIHQWRRVMDACRVLADDLNELFDAREREPRIELFSRKLDDEPRTK